MDEMRLGREGTPLRALPKFSVDVSLWVYFMHIIADK